MPISKLARLKYSPDWKLISLKLIWERAKNMCENCGNINGAKYGNKESRIILNVAHKNHIENDNREENLIVLCGPCHLNYDRKNNLKRRKMNKIMKKDIDR